VTPRHPMALAIVAVVAGCYGVPPDMIWKTSAGRITPTIAEAKQLVAWVLRNRMLWSFPEVGTALGQDHSTIIAACKRTVSRQESGHVTPAFHLAMRALSLEDLNSLLPDIATVRHLPSHSLAPASSVSPPLPLISGSGSSLKSESDLSLSSGSERPVSKPAREPKAKVTRWRFVPADWAPNDAHRKLALEQRVNIADEVKKFRDHEFREPKTDADRAFNRWLRMAGNGFGQSGTKPPGQGSHGEGGQAAPRRPELRPLLPPRPVQEATPLEVAAHLGQVLNRPAAPRVEPRGRMTATELDRAVEKMAAERGRT
jgi:hypothetical protein